MHTIPPPRDTHQLEATDSMQSVILPPIPVGETIAITNIGQRELLVQRNPEGQYAEMERRAKLLSELKGELSLEGAAAVHCTLLAGGEEKDLLAALRQIESVCRCLMSKTNPSTALTLTLPEVGQLISDVLLGPGKEYKIKS